VINLTQQYNKEFQKRLKTVEDKYKHFSVFDPSYNFDEDEDIELEHNDIGEVVSDGNQECVIASPIELLSREDKIKGLQAFYDSKNLFPKRWIMEASPMNTKGQFGRTPLHEAVLKQDLDAIKKLLQDGADATLTDNNGHTPLVVARLERFKKVIHLMKKMGIKK
jgi:hypothetical protein